MEVTYSYENWKLQITVDDNIISLLRQETIGIIIRNHLLSEHKSCSRFNEMNKFKNLILATIIIVAWLLHKPVVDYLFVIQSIKINTAVNKYIDKEFSSYYDIHKLLTDSIESKMHQHYIGYPKPEYTKWKVNSFILMNDMKNKFVTTLVSNIKSSNNIVFMLIPILHNYKREEHGQILKKITEITEAGKYTPVVDENEFSLEQVGDAYSLLESGKAVGKVVVEN